MVAVGGDLSVERLVLAYRSGIFPWPIFDDELMTWFSPDPRAVLDLDALRVNRTLRKALRREEIEVTFDTAFEEVIAACASPGPGRDSTWITRQLGEAYVRLHENGIAHSVEVWSGGVLTGGLYGVAINGLFAGESMFSRASNASKIALVHLVDRLKARGYRLLDIQQATPHMVKMGAVLISRREYLQRLERALAVECSFV